MLLLGPQCSFVDGGPVRESGLSRWFLWGFPSWAVTCSVFEICRRLGESYCFLLRVHFSHQRGCSTFLKNVGKFVPDYAALLWRRQQVWWWSCLFPLECSSHNLVNGLSEKQEALSHRLTFKKNKIMKKKKKRGRENSWACPEAKLRVN